MARSGSVNKSRIALASAGSHAPCLPTGDRSLTSQRPVYSSTASRRSAPKLRDHASDPACFATEPAIARAENARPVCTPGSDSSKACLKWRSAGPQGKAVAAKLIRYVAGNHHAGWADDCD